MVPAQACTSTCSELEPQSNGRGPPWAELRRPPNVPGEVLNPITQNGCVLGARAFNEVIKLKKDRWVGPKPLQLVSL